jgi:hypothetical protein
MEIKEAMRTVLRELILPELDRMKEEHRETRTLLSAMNQRLDDVNLHLADQSRRIDSLREELSPRIEATNTRIDRLYEVIVRRDEHTMVSDRVAILEQEVSELKRRLAA